jgi:hypothetical protein
MQVARDAPTGRVSGLHVAEKNGRFDQGSRVRIKVSLIRRHLLFLAGIRERVCELSAMTIFLPGQREGCDTNLLTLTAASLLMMRITARTHGWSEKSNWWQNECGGQLKRLISAKDKF